MAQNKELYTISEHILKIKVVESSKSIKTLQSEFEQVKHLSFLSNDITSKGELKFKLPNTIKWEYTTPFQYAAIFKNDQLYINDDGRKNKVSLKSNATFKSLNNLLIRSVTGDMFDDAIFEIKYFENEKNYIASFQPRDEKIKKLIHQFELYFSKQSFYVQQVKMLETSEDFTLLKFYNQKYNSTLLDEEFNH